MALLHHISNKHIQSAHGSSLHTLINSDLLPVSPDSKFPDTMVSAKNNPRRADNVFFGPSSLKDYYNPDHHPPLPLVELPEYLNPFYHDGVRIFAKMMTMLPAHNVKALPALAMLSSEEVVSEKTRTVVEYSSGSTIISMSIISRVLHGIYDVRAFLSNKTSENKLRLMQFFGLDMLVVPGNKV